MRYRQHVVLTIDVDDSTFDGDWPLHYPWAEMVREYLQAQGRSTQHLDVAACGVESDILDRGYLDRDGPEDGYGYGYRPGMWRHMATEPEHVPYYVNVYEVDQGYGGPEEGGWWFSVGIPVEEACEVYETPEAAEIARQALVEQYPATGKQYSVLGGADYAVQIEDHPPRAWPETRPHYC